MDLACLCEALTGLKNQNICMFNGKAVAKLKRKEYRLMSDDERTRFNQAMLNIKQNGKFWLLVDTHSNMQTTLGAHAGPAFLPWHREFIKRLEFELRRVDPEVFLPYWDSTLESRLPAPKDSSLFSPELMGTGTGALIDGPFANWMDLNNRFLQRQVGFDGSPFTDEVVEFLLNRANLMNMLAYSFPREGCFKDAKQQKYSTNSSIEGLHAEIHLWIGGHMLDPMTSANDPIFYLHHAFVDLIWETWRQSKQKRNQMENEYPSFRTFDKPSPCATSFHDALATMVPFSSLQNRDGLSLAYTDNLYEYAPRPTCSVEDLDCGSRFLFCDVSHGALRCASKIRLGGNCTGYANGEDACYNGICKQDVCQELPPEDKASSLTTAVSTSQVCTNVGRLGQPKLIYCADRHFSCVSWAQSGECLNNPIWMAENCRRSCNQCQQTRATACRNPQVFAKPAPGTIKCNGSTECYNKNACCPYWASRSVCKRKPEFMNCNCRVSCGLCTPSNYLYGGCNDYHQECRMWAQRGECKRSTWMEENCRASCGTCFDMLGLASRCPSTSGATLIANVKPLETLIDNGKIYQEMEPVIVGENMFDGHIIEDWEDGE
ncbi:unnamed protein product, partial [Mesorhabditis belari]|uniref:ShKT domain-containing protein n=1 Tax=Mesorhabditis belari TaxID=2138241 RepID=A0AAF3FNB6_9BILA